MKKTLFILSSLFYLQTNAQLCFGPAATKQTSTNAYSICSADFNGDGNKDLAAAANGSNNVSVLLNLGAGVFGNSTNFTVGNTPSSVVSADFNADGKFDLAVANLNSHSVSILLGTGTGSFGAATSYTLGNTSSPNSVTTGDFNGDGKLDLALASSVTSSSGKVGILLNTGSGNFGTVTNFTVGTAPNSVISADFNGDSKLDLAVANKSSNNVSILIGTGTGSFGTATNFSVGTNPYTVTGADFNGDSKVDLAVSNYGSNNISILLGTGTGSFGTATNFSGGTNPVCVKSSDFDGNGKLDLAIANTGGVSILLGTGTGSFGTATTFTTGSSSWSVVGADFNGDSKVDLATANNLVSNVSILLNCTGVGIEGFTSNPILAVYPNPNNGIFSIEINSASKQTVTICDITGKIFLNQTISGITSIDASHLVEGIYNISLSTNEGVLNRRMIIVK